MVCGFDTFRRLDLNNDGKDDMIFIAENTIYIEKVK